MLNPVLKYVHFLDQSSSEFWGTLWYFTLVNMLELVQLSISYMPVNIEFAKFALINIFLVVEPRH